MAEKGTLAKFLKIFGMLYFVCNVLIFVVICIMAIYSSGKYLQFSPGWTFLLVPAIGMFSGYWIRAGKYGWARSLVIAASLICSAALLFIVFVIGPQMKDLEAETFKKMQAGQQKLLEEKTARMFTGVYGADINIVKEQLAEGVDVNAINETRQTALHVTQNTEIARLLIEHGADIHAKDDTGTTPIFNKEIKIAGILLDTGVDMNSRNEKGNTLLIRYTHAGYLQGIKFLVARGADINSCNSDKNNALDIAEHFHPESEVLKYLQSLEIQNCPE